MNESTLFFNYVTPRFVGILGSQPCDYYIGMFPDLGVQSELKFFNNIVAGYEDQKVEIKNDNDYLVNATNGVLLNLGQNLVVNKIKLTAQKAVTLQFWLKGTLKDTFEFASVYSSSNSKVVSIRNNFINFVATSDYAQNSDIFLANAAFAIDPKSWMFIGLSFSWVGSSQDFEICAFAQQDEPVYYESGNCMYNVSIPASDIDNGLTIHAEIGPGATGYIKQVYITNVLETPLVFVNIQEGFDKQRFNCFNRNFLIDPHYIHSE
mmetsp:Transcript_13444/g.15613  ORF Transcript_13444/g.15613 Transcript_13444/m.15613 type:complete len:264 (+) Transcript_13444:674-1465(+)